ncbi:DUF6484 domain-containing protein [Paraliomyxa miuraensis]|uniref:DUF6484 domain-containing protein n=1 Tax=Paraliomyxa miuraensis TaxID=376150 RepID=UPI002250390E|nr:DUF6484 domain-containing protein [Paraliomyxa miuraensis]MCX4239623.1 DUF6484 domain-containing protein [Paraliomyxa miuraensis]
MGTVVEVSQDGEVVVELVAPNGECLRCKALATVPVESAMVGQPVELTFIEGHLDRPVVTRPFDMKAEFRAQWDALGRKVLGLDSDPRKLAELLECIGSLACMTALLDAAGNVTHGAMSVGAGRRTFREHVRRWKLNNPHFAPMLEALGVGRPKAKRQSVGEADCAADRSHPESHEEGTR